MSGFLPETEKRYQVFTDDFDIGFKTREEAEHFARLNAGCVVDTLTYEVLSTYIEDNEN